MHSAQGSGVKGRGSGVRVCSRVSISKYAEILTDPWTVGFVV